MLKMIHPVAGAVALLMISTFWLSTLFAELFGSEAFVVGVKTSISPCPQPGGSGYAGNGRTR